MWSMNLIFLLFVWNFHCNQECKLKHFKWEDEAQSTCANRPLAKLIRHQIWFLLSEDQCGERRHQRKRYILLFKRPQVKENYLTVFVTKFACLCLLSIIFLLTSSFLSSCIRIGSRLWKTLSCCLINQADNLNPVHLSICSYPNHLCSSQSVSPHCPKRYFLALWCCIHAR